MADDNIFDPKKIIEKLRAQGIPDKEIAKMFGELPPPKKDVPNSERAKKLQRENAWKYKNKHQREVRDEDIDPDYEPIEELRNPKPKPPKPRITRKKKKKVKRPTRNDWSAAAEERLKTLFEAGYSIAEIAKDFNTTADAITGKIGRMRKSGWHGMVGTTHNPLPSPAPQNKKKESKLNPLLRRELATILETNFGLVGKYFSKKWGLHDDKKSIGSPTGSSTKGDLAVSIIAGNQAIVSSLIKLDMSLRRGTSALTKAMSLSTAKMTDAISNTVEILKKQGVIEQTTGQQQQTIGSNKSSGGSGALGILGAVLGGTLLSALFSTDAEASVNPLDGVGQSPFPTENELRERGEELKEEEPPKEVEVKVKELIFDAQDIEFDADNFKFVSKSGQETNFGPQQIGKANPSGSKSGGGGFWNRLFGGGETFPDGGGVGAAAGAPGGGSGSPIPSDADMAAKDKKWFGGGSKAAPGSTPPNEIPSQSLLEQRQKFAEELKNDPELRENIRAMASAEEGPGANNSDARKAVIETMMNRAVAQGKTLGEVVRNQEYYQPYQNGSYNQHLSRVRGDKDYATQLDKEIDDVLKGSNYSNYATHNGSGSVRANAERTQSTGWIAPNGEIFSRKDRSEFSNIHGAGTTSRESEWYKKTKAADESAANAKNGRDRLYVAPNRDASMITTPPPTSGVDLLGAQKEQDNQSFEDRWNSRVAPEKRSDASDPGAPSNDTIQTTLLETQGPNHFHDFPMSDQGVGA